MRLHNRRSRLLLVVVLGWAVHGGAHETTSPDGDTAAPLADADTDDTNTGHGAFSIGYQNTYVNGMLLGGKPLPIGTVRVQTIDLGIDYDVGDHWSVNAGIPFTSSRFDATPFAPPHCPTTVPAPCRNAPALSPPHPESQFLDDGRAHATWSDWSFGVAYDANIGDYFISPSLTAYIPSHNYTFFANAAVGQDLQRVELGVTLAHQFDFSNIYYRVGYRYAFVERTLGISINHSKLDLDLGYFITPEVSVNLFALGKFGGGLQAAELLPLTDNLSNAYWYHHDQISAHEYLNLGTSLDYRFDRYTVTTALQRLVWGRTVYDFKYKFDVSLTRTF